jgi:hypothetical protein
LAHDKALSTRYTVMETELRMHYEGQEAELRGHFELKCKQIRTVQQTLEEERKEWCAPNACCVTPECRCLTPITVVLLQRHNTNIIKRLSLF